MSLKNPVTPRGIDPGTVRLVAQRLKHYASPGPMLANSYLNCVAKLKKKADWFAARQKVLNCTSAHSSVLQEKGNMVVLGLPVGLLHRVAIGIRH